MANIKDTGEEAHHVHRWPMRILLQALLIVLMSVPYPAQRWKMTLRTQEEMNAYQFYQEMLLQFRKKGRWPKGGDTARFVLVSKSMYKTPNILGYFLPAENGVHMLADTGAINTVLRTSMAHPSEREVRILFEATVLVHEFSVHWNQFNNRPTVERREFEEQFSDAFEKKQLNDSLVVLHLFNGMKREREAYLEVLKYLRRHLDQGLFSKANFRRAVGSSTIGFYEKYHNPESVEAKFLQALARNDAKYKAQPRRSPPEEYAVSGYSAIIGLLTRTLHEIRQFEDALK